MTVARVCDVVAAHLRETGNPAIMWDDETLAHEIAEQLGWKRGWKTTTTTTRLFDALSKTPGELVLEHLSLRGRAVRSFRLPEAAPVQLDAAGGLYRSKPRSSSLPADLLPEDAVVTDQSRDIVSVASRAEVPEPHTDRVVLWQDGTGSVERFHSRRTDGALVVWSDELLPEHVQLVRAALEDHRQILMTQEGS